jgi:hypothetical protein
VSLAPRRSNHGASMRRCDEVIVICGEAVH